MLKTDLLARKTTSVIDLTLKLPLNATITINEDLGRILRDVDLYNCLNEDENNRKNTAIFKMTENGLLCLKDTTKHNQEAGQ